jgi:hypothetical protein
MRRGLKLLAAGAALIGATALAAPAAAAPAQRIPCPDGRLCLYQHANGEGFMTSFGRGEYISDLSDRYCSNCNANSNWNDVMSSFINRTGRTFYWFEHSYSRPPRHNMNATHPVDAFTLPQHEQDTASSINTGP